MLALIWLVVGVLLGRFVVRRSVALGLTAVLWAITVVTIAARNGPPWQYGADSIGVFATLVLALLGVALGAFLRRRPATHGSPAH
jgi:uncharacterized protein YneF (UPF0154 family)